MAEDPREITRKEAKLLVPDAEINFQKSLEAGEADYRFVALAIGEKPHDPPLWAMRACRDLRNSEMQKSLRGSGYDAMGQILNSAILFRIQHEDAFEADADREAKPYIPPSLRRILIEGLKAQGYDFDCESQIKSARRAWNDEAAYDLIGQHEYFMGPADLPRTRRVQLVYGRTAAADYFDGEDLSDPAFKMFLFCKQNRGCFRDAEQLFDAIRDGTKPKEP